MPSIPDWIKQLRVPGNKNIFELYEDLNLMEPKRLFGTETLYGDWNGKILIVAQDFSNAQYIRNLAWDGDEDPYHHDENNETNINLSHLIESFGVTKPTSRKKATSCGILYVSASYFLKETDAISSNIPSFSKVRDKSEPVFRYVLNNMPNLKYIVLAGGTAFYWVTKWLNINMKDCKFSKCRDKQQVFETGSYKIFVSAHPGPLGLAQTGGIKRVKETWEQFAKNMVL
jgi:hypothetical protein